MISHGVELVGPYGLGDAFIGWPVEEGATTTMAAEAAARAVGQDTDHSTTNVQVVGVDEPDMVKTDGRRIVVLSEGMLILADVTGREPVETGRLEVGDFMVQSMFLTGDTVLLFGSGWMPVVPLAKVMP